MLTKSQMKTIERVEKLFRQCHNPQFNSVSIEICEENERAVYLHCVAHWKGMGEVDGSLYSIFTSETIIRITKRGAATYLDRHLEVQRFRFDRAGMFEAEMEYKLTEIV